MNREDAVFIDSLGPCCSCRGPGARVITMIEKKAPMKGRGWGCTVCGLPSDGALAVQCQPCADTKKKLRFACKGYAASDGRVPIARLRGTHKHNMKLHKEA